MNEKIISKTYVKTDKEKTLADFLKNHRLVKAICESLPDDVNEEYLSHHINFSLEHFSPKPREKIQKLNFGSWTREPISKPRPKPESELNIVEENIGYDDNPTKMRKAIHEDYGD